MRRRRRFKVQLAFGGAVAVLFVFYAWNYHDLIKDVTREDTPLTREISGKYRFTVESNCNETNEKQTSFCLAKQTCCLGF